MKLESLLKVYLNIFVSLNALTELLKSFMPVKKYVNHAVKVKIVY